MEISRARFHEKALKTMADKTINDILTKDNWKKEDVRKACMTIRQYQHKLGYSGAWMSEYVYNVVLLAKKEPKPHDVEQTDKNRLSVRNSRDDPGRGNLITQF